MKLQNPAIASARDTRSPCSTLCRKQPFTLPGVIVLGVAFFLPIKGIAAEVAPESEIARCIHQAAGGRPWLERTLWGLRDQEAGWIGAEVANANGSHDLGPLQVNSSWVPKIAGMLSAPPDSVRHWLTHDACFNVNAARWIFLTGLASSRDYWRAVGIYHSPTGWRQERYRRLMAAKLVGRFGSDVFAGPRRGENLAQIP
ncbi:lytic transglycosylase domain-containing protein [Novosphingobium sp. BL-52-GroH]|uniref:lytic transglycosylase domain-containing protein n=1 Tax=Novosphingobium sp. BL-52-GroH TaxID=3349877 RepID=UPI00384DEF50